MQNTNKVNEYGRDTRIEEIYERVSEQQKNL